MVRSYPFPAAQSFQRLQINDGLLMTADIWRRAHYYHRHRQNFVHQALYHPAIIDGLGVAVVDPPDQLQSTYRDARWIEVQPGIAIDMEGNPIVVPQPQTFHIESEPPTNGTLLVYLVLSYVDPDELQTVVGDRLSVTEQFRIVEKTTLNLKDIELCRILLKGEEISLKPATKTFQAEVNEIDFHHRPTAQMRPVGEIRLAQLTAGSSAEQIVTTQLSSLLKAVSVVYPRYQGITTIERIAATQARQSGKQVPLDIFPVDCDVLYAPWSLLQNYAASHLEKLSNTLAQGTTLVINATLQDAALNRSSSDQEIEFQVRQLVQALDPLATGLNNPLVGDGAIDAFHPLRVEPFFFAQWPLVEGVPLLVFQWGAIVLIVGDIVPYWGPDGMLQRPREVIRTAQEFGINLLLFAWQHRTYLQLQKQLVTPIAQRQSQDSLQSRFPKPTS
jgi:hypothetical protein